MDIQAIALPYAADDRELKDFLTKKPKPIETILNRIISLGAERKIARSS